MKASVRVYVSAGSNIEPRANLEAACKTLNQHYGELELSPLYQSPAEGFSGPDFFNLVVGFETTESPGEIRKRIAELEALAGRDRSGGKFSSRTLDLDLLLYGARIDASLKLPHPDIERYAFVLKPLADLAPDLRHPVSGTKLSALCEQLPIPRQLTPVPPLRLPSPCAGSRPSSRRPPTASR